MILLIFVSVLSLFLTSIEFQSEKMCDFFKPNGSYEGLDLMNVYRDEPLSDEYYMFNRKGVEWKFNLNVNHTELYLVPGKNNEIDNLQIIKMFSIYLKVPVIKHLVDCHVNENHISDIYCLDQNGTTKSGNVDGLDRDTIIFLGYTYDGNHTNYSVLLNRQDKRRIYLGTESDSLSDLHYHDECPENSTCPNTDYIDQMDDSLLTRLDGVVDYVVNGTNQGIVLLFNIDGRPMFCFHSYGKNISEDCQSTDHLIPIHEECFSDVSGLTNISDVTNVSDVPDDSIDPLYYVLFGEVILAAILIVAALVMIDVRRRRFESRQSTTNDISVNKSTDI